VYGYDRIPDSLLSDSLPPQIGNPAHERLEQLRDRLVVLGLQEVISYRLTTPEREGRLPSGTEAQAPDYLRLANPIASDRTSMRRSVLASVLETVAANARQAPRLAIFELGPAFEPRPGQELPREPLRLAMALRGPRGLPTWLSPDSAAMGFFDVKGIVEALAADLHLAPLRWETGEHPSYHPAKCARVWLGDDLLGWAGELHPRVVRAYGLPEGAVAAADLDAQSMLDAMPDRHSVTAVPEYPPVLEDVAVVVDEAVPAGQVADVIRRAGGESLASVRLFDLYRGDPVPQGKKSLAFALVYQAPDRTLTDAEAARIRAAIVRDLQAEWGASLRA
jgi:phenylalanyl-tRNA synthetase beta chain